MATRTEELKAERERIQKKTFTKWANSHIVKMHGPQSAINDAQKDFDSGIALMKLINSLYQTPIPRHNPKPKMRPHMVSLIIFLISYFYAF